MKCIVIKANVSKRHTMLRISRSIFKKKKSVIHPSGKLLSEELSQMLNPCTSNIAGSAKLLEVQRISIFLNFVLELCL